MVSKFLRDKKNQGVVFIIKFFVLFFALNLFYDYYIEPYTQLDEGLIRLIIAQSESTLTFLDHELLPSNSLYNFHIGIKNTSGVIIGAPCNGISLFILYFSFITVFKGKWYTKLILSLVGALIIHLLNLSRVIALVFVVKYSPESLDFHHKYSFTLFVYACVFSMWYLRIKLYQKFEKKN